MSHARDFGLESGNTSASEKIIYDYRLAGLSSEDSLLCDYAIRLTKTPGAMSASDVETLRQSGFSDEEISVAVQVTGYFNYINRVADGLGVETEDWMTISRDDWQRQKAAY